MSSSSTISFTHIGFTKVSKEEQMLYFFKYDEWKDNYTPVGKCLGSPIELFALLKKTQAGKEAKFEWKTKQYRVSRENAGAFVVKKMKTKKEAQFLSQEPTRIWPDPKKPPQEIKALLQELSSRFVIPEMKNRSAQTSSFTNVSNQGTPSRDEQMKILEQNFRLQQTANNAGRKVERLKKQDQEQKKRLLSLAEQLQQKNKEISDLQRAAENDSGDAISQDLNQTKVMPQNTDQDLIQDEVISKNLDETVSTSKSTSDSKKSRFPAWTPLLLAAGMLLIYVAIRPKVQTWNILKPLTPID